MRGEGRKEGWTNARSKEREKSRRRDCRGDERDRRGRKGAAGSVRFVLSFFRCSWFEAYRSRGPGRTILLDLCARAISRSSRDLPRATNIVAITSCSWLFALAGPRDRLFCFFVSGPDFFNPRTGPYTIARIYTTFLHYRRFSFAPERSQRCCPSSDRPSKFLAKRQATRKNCYPSRANPIDLNINGIIMKRFKGHGITINTRSFLVCSETTLPSPRSSGQTTLGYC